MKLSLSTPQRHVGEAEEYIHTSLTLALDGGEWSKSLPDHFTTGKEPRYQLNRRLGGPHSRFG
jgi:hypothetical protein